MYLSVSNIFDSVDRKHKNYYSHVFLEELNILYKYLNKYKYFVKEKKMSEHNTDDIKISSNDSGKENSDEENSDKENSDEENFDEKN